MKTRLSQRRKGMIEGLLEGIVVSIPVWIILAIFLGGEIQKKFKKFRRNWREYKRYKREKNYWLDYDLSVAEYLNEHY